MIHLDGNVDFHVKFTDLLFDDSYVGQLVQSNRDGFLLVEEDLQLALLVKICVI